jgi:hypothetical protein
MKKPKRMMAAFIILPLLTLVFFADHGVSGVYVSTGTFLYFNSELSDNDDDHNWYDFGSAAIPAVRDLQNTPIHAYSGWASVSITVADREPLSDSGSMWAKVYAYRYADGTVERRFKPGQSLSVSTHVRDDQNYSGRGSGTFY